MRRRRVLTAAATVLALAAMQMERGAGVAQAQHNGQVPRFEYDPTWPKPFPNETWAIGTIAGLAVDRQDHIWAVQRPAPPNGRAVQGRRRDPAEGRVLHPGAARA